MITFVTGARPNFIKVKPMMDRCDLLGVNYNVFNSNQHDPNMQVFKMGNVKSKSVRYSHNREGRFVFIMSEFCKFLIDGNYTSVVIVGDTDTSLACALTADMMNIPVIHVEAGMRSFYKMPEETNRVAIDRISSIRFTPTIYNTDLLNIEKLSSIMSGNIMVEALIKNWIPSKLDMGKYVLVEVHRAENDDKLQDITKLFKNMEFPVKWVKHPRHLYKYETHCNITYMEPQSYNDMLNLVSNAILVITDSGGLQVDTAYIGVPCITFREQTEWSITVERGSNLLLSDVGLIDRMYKGFIKDYKKVSYKDQLWDDKVSDRIIKTMIKEKLV